jgi:hypothetical protein
MKKWNNVENIIIKITTRKKRARKRDNNIKKFNEKK